MNNVIVPPPLLWELSINNMSMVVHSPGRRCFAPRLDVALRECSVIYYARSEGYGGLPLLEIERVIDMKQNRLRSPVFWGSVAAQIISVGQLAGLWTELGIDTGVVGDIVAGILQLGVLFGLLNDPTSADRF